jgi:hypothetical protein
MTRKPNKPTRAEQLKKRKPSRTVHAPDQLDFGFEPSSREHFATAGLPDNECQRVAQEISAAADRTEARRIVTEADLKSGQFSAAQMARLTDLYRELPE